MSADLSLSTARPGGTVLYRWTVAAAIALSLAMMAARIGVLNFGPDSFDRFFIEFPKALFSGVYDVLFMSIISAVALLIIYVCRNHRWLRRAAFAIYLVTGVLVLGASIANIQVIPLLGRPFSYQWLYYSDFVFSHEAMASISPSITPGFMKFVYADYAGALGLTFIAVGAITLLRKWFTRRELCLTTVPLLLIYLWIGNWYLQADAWPTTKTVNPVVAFGQSVIQAMNQPPLVSMPSPFGSSDFAAAKDLPGPTTRAVAPPAKPIKNVIFFVMESTASQYMSYYGGDYNITPNLERYRNQSASFKDIYALTPSTNSTMLSLLCSCYPWPSFKSVFSTCPQANLNCFAQTMKASGHRTGIFSSADLHYGEANAFLGKHGFDKIEDSYDRKSAKHTFVSDWTYLYGTSDWETVDSLTSWIGPGDAAAQKPFFAVLWTIQSHYPYYLTQDVKKFQDNPQVNQYLSAVSESDWALGQLLDWLKKNNLSDSTLVVVMGDHGEAFGQHNNFGHATGVYEENIGIPLVLINPQLFHGEKYYNTGSTADVLPTVAECLNIPDAPLWQGRSLLHTSYDRRMYHVQPYSDLQFAYREGNLKMIYSAWTDSAEVYDLGADQWEKHNIADQKADFVTAAKQRLASWVKYQNAYYDDAFQSAPAPVKTPVIETADATK